MNEQAVSSNPHSEAAVPQRAGIERHLIEVFRTLLNVSHIGASDNFFLLGGHSLVGTRVIARIRDSFGVELSLQTLFDSPTIESLALEVERLMASAQLQPPDPERHSA